MVTFLLLEFLQPFSYLGMKGLRFPTFQAVDAVEHSLEKKLFLAEFQRWVVLLTQETVFFVWVASV